MKSQSIAQKRPRSQDTDKRDLVNLDLYNNEIKVMEEQLNKVTEKHPRAKGIAKRIEQLKEHLQLQKDNLQRFRENFIPEEMILASSKITRRENSEPVNNESFFGHLKSFEDVFKNTRKEVTDFVNKWL